MPTQVVSYPQCEHKEGISYDSRRLLLTPVGSTQLHAYMLRSEELDNEATAMSIIYVADPDQSTA